MPDDLVAGLEPMNARDIRFAFSYDGMTGKKEHGPELSGDLGNDSIVPTCR